MLALILFQEFGYFVFVFSLTWLLPLLVMLGSYLTIILIIVRRARMMKNQSESKSMATKHDLIRRTKIKTIKITGVLVIGFCLCWIPYNTMYIW